MPVHDARWRVLVADDEPAARRGVIQLLSAFPEFAVAGECRDGREVLDALDRIQPDAVFLDVQMPEIGGLEVMRRLPGAYAPAVVFLTAYDEFAIKAFETEALDYLLKPVSEARFAATMKRIARRLRSKAADPPAILVPTPRGTTVVELRDIEWFEAADDYTRIWVGSRSYLLRQSLDDLEQRVSAHGFMRVHRGALIPLARVRALKRQAGGDLVAVLSCGANVTVSRRRRPALLVALRGRAQFG